MCVMSIGSFDRGWRCMLIDKEAAGDAFPTIKRDYDKPKYREQGEFIFRLTIWRGKKYPGRVPDFIQGEIVFINEVSGFKTFCGVLQGITDMDDFIKEDDEDAQGYKKKTKTTTDV